MQIFGGSFPNTARIDLLPSQVLFLRSGSGTLWDKCSIYRTRLATWTELFLFHMPKNIKMMKINFKTCVSIFVNDWKCWNPHFYKWKWVSVGFVPELPHWTNWPKKPGPSIIAYILIISMFFLYVKHIYTVFILTFT